MTPEEFKSLMEAIKLKEETEHDTEDTHWEADELMCEVLTQLGYGEGISVFKDMKKWYA